MNNLFVKLLTLAAAILVSGCFSIPEGRLSVVGVSQPSVVVAAGPHTGNGQIVHGKDCAYWFLIGGFPSVETAVHNALADSGATSLREAKFVLQNTFLFLGIRACILVEGIPMIPELPLSEH